MEGARATLRDGRCEVAVDSGDVVGPVRLGDISTGTSGVERQYGIGVHAAGLIASIAARVRLYWRAVMENRTSNFVAVANTALE